MLMMKIVDGNILARMVNNGGVPPAAAAPPIFQQQQAPLPPVISHAYPGPQGNPYAAPNYNAPASAPVQPPAPAVPNMNNMSPVRSSCHPWAMGYELARRNNDRSYKPLSR